MHDRLQIAAGRRIAWAWDSFDAMQPYAGARVYVNFLAEEGSDRAARGLTCHGH